MINHDRSRKMLLFYQIFACVCKSHGQYWPKRARIYLIKFPNQSLKYAVYLFLLMQYEDVVLLTSLALCLCSTLCNFVVLGGELIQSRLGWETWIHCVAQLDLTWLVKLTHCELQIASTEGASSFVKPWRKIAWLKKSIPVVLGELHRFCLASPENSEADVHQLWITRERNVSSTNGKRLIE